MCGHCGCDAANHSPTHAHEHVTVDIQKNILSFNDTCAHDNRHYFKQKNYKVFNLMSAPGSGKTTLLQQTIQALSPHYPMGVVVGDQYTELDAQALRTQEVPSIQINTQESCHLDAHQILHAREDLHLPDGAFIFIENIGNLVCPAAFDLGENYKIVMLSVTEGEHKPLKYAPMFHHADVLIINKCDLLPYVSFSIERSMEYAWQVNPKLKIFCLSCTQPDAQESGLKAWYDWLIHA